MSRKLTREEQERRDRDVRLFEQQPMNAPAYADLNKGIDLKQFEEANTVDIFGRRN